MIKNISIGATAFQFISMITPDVDIQGHIIEERPASRYDNVKGLKLNEYGNGPFCRFKIPTGPVVARDLDTLGVYAIFDETVKALYIGKCTGRTSTLFRRFNSGYGVIYPRNCYRGGQSTNCRINNLILTAMKRGSSLAVFFHRTPSGFEASVLEAALIGQTGKPTWNIQQPKVKVASTGNSLTTPTGVSGDILS